MAKENQKKQGTAPNTENQTKAKKQKQSKKTWKITNLKAVQSLLLTTQEKKILKS